ncbi:MAG: hypothetical protein J4G15_07550 [Alphaproteobacteria bacterium]|nr:hypothetical protein [Alphaproteobacteria bacterium]
MRGLGKMRAQVKLALAVMKALAHASVEERKPDLMVRALVRTGTVTDAS